MRFLLLADPSTYGNESPVAHTAAHPLRAGAKTEGTAQPEMSYTGLRTMFAEGSVWFASTQVVDS